MTAKSPEALAPPISPLVSSPKKGLSPKKGPSPPLGGSRGTLDDHEAAFTEGWHAASERLEEAVIERIQAAETAVREQARQDQVA